MSGTKVAYIPRTYDHQTPFHSPERSRVGAGAGAETGAGIGAGAGAGIGAGAGSSTTPQHKTAYSRGWGGE